MRAVWNNAKARAILFLGGGIACLAVAATLVVFFAGRWGGDEPRHLAGPALHLSRDEIQAGGDNWPPPPAVKTEKEEHWVLYVTGAVRRPGVYRLPPGSRVYELVEQAGGMTADAAPEAFNMAAPLGDGMHIHVPERTELVQPSGEGAQVNPSSRGSLAYADPSPEDDRIDINRADAQTLERLPGVGPKTAEEIIRYRNEEGPFRCVEDLLGVRGIGPAKLEALRERVRTGR